MTHKGKANREKSSRLIEIRTGQNNLHYIKNKISGDNNLFRLSEENKGTFDHFVNDCPTVGLFAIPGINRANHALRPF